MEKEQIMKLGVDQARITMNMGVGGPFGAAIVKNGEIIAVASNRVLATNDPTAHAEITAIRMACRRLDTYDLSGCEIYATGYPCPMCMSAIIWANIKKVYVAAYPQEAEKIGFRDDYIYRFIEGQCSDTEVVDIEKMDDTEVKKLYQEYADTQKIIY